MSAPAQYNSIIQNENEIELATRALKAMAHPLRLKILCLLGDLEFNVQGITDIVGSSQSNISQHLAGMREKGVLVCRRDANSIYYRIGNPRTIALVFLFRDVFCGFGEDQPA